MRMGKNSFYNIIKLFVLATWAAIVSMIMIGRTTVYAAEGNKYILDPVAFEVPIQNRFLISDEYIVKTFTHEETPLGEFSITGDIAAVKETIGIPAYVSSGTVEMHFTYDAELQSEDPERWNLCSSRARNISDIMLKEDIAQGALIIQKSDDGENWENASDPYYDFLKKEKDNLIVYEVNEQERIAGTYYRIVLAYQVEQLSEKHADFSIAGVDLPIDVPVWSNDKFEYLCCTQIYKFYVCSEESPVILRDVISGKDISDQDTVNAGFQIDKRASGAYVNIEYNGERIEDIPSYEAFYDPGDYIVEIETNIKATYQYHITVEEGIAFETIYKKGWLQKLNSDRWKSTYGCRFVFSFEIRICKRQHL